MRLKTLSSYRLRTKAFPVNQAFNLSKGLSFSVLKSTESDSFEQFYVLDTNWDKNGSSKIVPLAHVQVSNVTGSVKIASFQPENWNLSTDNTDLISELTDFIKKISLSSHFSLAH